MEQSYLSTTVAPEWQRWSGRNLEVSNDALRLASEPSIEYTNLRVGAVDISVDRDGAVLMLDETGDIQWYEDEYAKDETVWTNGDGKDVEDPRALCVSGDLLYVADGASGDLVLVSRRSSTAVGRISAGLDDPVDVIRADRRIYILDAGTDERRGRVLTLRHNRVVETIIRGLNSPSDLTADSSYLYVVEQDDDLPVVRVYDIGHLESPSIIPTSRTIDDLVVPESGDSVTPIRIEVLTDRELVLVGRVETGETALYHYTFEGNGGTLIRRDDFPLSCSKLLTGPRNQDRRYPKYYAIAGEQTHVYIVDERQTNKRNPADGRYSAQAFRRLDSGSIDTEWDRLTLTLENFPANTQVVTSYYATNYPTERGSVEDLELISEDDAEDLRQADIRSLWDLLERDVYTIATVVDQESTDRIEDWREAAVDALDDATDWITTDSANQQDILLENVTGQYLHVRLELVGGTDSSPAVDSFRAYCPKQTYLRYLPEYFQRTKGDGQFLQRYLSVFENEFVDIEEKIDRMTRYFDPEGVPKEYLGWLSDWLAIEYDEEWPTGAKQEFLTRAPTLFKLRGTKEGMQRTIRLYLHHVESPNTTWMAEWRKQRIDERRTDDRITDADVGDRLRTIDEQSTGYPGGHMLFFVEHLDLDGITSESARQPYTMHMDGPRSFAVFIGPFVSDTHQRAVERIVATERPAHTDGNVVELRQELKLEGRSFLGINSTLTTREFVLGRSTLGGDTVLKEREPIS